MYNCTGNRRRTPQPSLELTSSSKSCSRSRCWRRSSFKILASLRASSPSTPRIAVGVLASMTCRPQSQTQLGAARHGRAAGLTTDVVIVALRGRSEGPPAAAPAQDAHSDSTRRSPRTRPCPCGRLLRPSPAQNGSGDGAIARVRARTLALLAHEGHLGRLGQRMRLVRRRLLVALRTLQRASRLSPRGTRKRAGSETRIEPLLAAGRADRDLGVEDVPTGFDEAQRRGG